MPWRGGADWRHRCRRIRDATGVPARGGRRPKRPAVARARERAAPRRRLERQLARAAELPGPATSARSAARRGTGRALADGASRFTLTRRTAARRGVPVSSCILTSAALPNSQTALSPAHLTAGRITSLHDRWTAPTTRPGSGPAAGRSATFRSSPPSPHPRGPAGAPGRGPRAAGGQPPPGRPSASARRLDRRAGQRAPQGRVRRPPDPRPWPRQGDDPRFGICALSIDQLIRLLH